MTTEIMQGQPEDLKDRLDALIGGGKTISMVVPLSQKSWYLIIYS